MKIVPPRARRIGVLFLAILLAATALAAQEGMPSLEVEIPPVALSGVPLEVQVRAVPPPETPLAVEVSWVPAVGDPVAGATAILDPANPAASLEIEIERAGRGELFVSAEGWETSQGVRCIPGWLSLLPAVLAIVLALVLRSVIPALLAGVWVGALLVSDLNPWAALLRTIDTYILGALAEPDHAAVVIFSMMMGGMVGIMGRSGGTAGIVRALAPLARTRTSAQIATWVVGMVVFFDDYANSLIVGNTMRPVTDRLRVSREKLAYIVDSTAAPVVSLAVVSSWIGFEVGLIGDAFKAAGHDQNAYLTFLASIPYRFYPILALWLVVLVAWTGRDLGPMAKAEKRAFHKGLLVGEGAEPLADAESLRMQSEEGVEPRWWNAVVPILVVIIASFAGLWVTGRQAMGPDAGLRDIFGAADPFKALLWASLLGVIAAMGLALVQRILTLQKTLEAWLTGVKAMVLAMLVLLLAWSIGQVTNGDLHAADWLAGVVSDTLDPRLLPALVFVLAAGISFATGTSWGTMGILMPLVIPVCLQLTAAGPEGIQQHVLLGTVSSVLAGAVFGDHCSPISDTTVLSSMASACDHVDHVRTQFPYALLAGGVGLVLGDLITAFIPHPAAPWAALLLGGAILWGVLRWRGRLVEDDGSPEASAEPE